LVEGLRIAMRKLLFALIQNLAMFRSKPTVWIASAWSLIDCSFTTIPVAAKFLRAISRNAP
jgi:hypothetical protein